MFASMIVRDNQRELTLTNGSRIKAFPQSEVTIRGYHPHIKIMDEKARIKREILESAIRPMGRKVCWLEIGISTPFGMGNNHYEDCSRPEFFHVKLLKPTEVSWVDEKKLAKEAAIIGDRIARQELYAEFIEDANAVFQPAWIENMLQLHLQPQQKGKNYTDYWLGVDYGKHRDYTAICVMHSDEHSNYIIDVLERHLHASYVTIQNRIFDLCRAFNIKLVVPDGSGVGTGLLDFLQVNVGVPIYWTTLRGKRVRDKRRAKRENAEKLRPGFVFTNQSKLNLVDLSVRIMMANRLRCPHHFNTTDPRNNRYIFKVLENEMIQFTYERTPRADAIRFSHPEDGKSHDDTLISVMLAIWGAEMGGSGNGIPRIGGAAGRRVQYDRKTGKPIVLRRDGYT
jgi:hypothetical protein